MIGSTNGYTVFAIKTVCCSWTKWAYANHIFLLDFWLTTLPSGNSITLWIISRLRMFVPIQMYCFNRVMLHHTSISFTNRTHNHMYMQCLCYVKCSVWNGKRKRIVGLCIYMTRRYLKHSITVNPRPCRGVQPPLRFFLATRRTVSDSLLKFSVPSGASFAQLLAFVLSRSCQVTELDVIKGTTSGQIYIRYIGYCFTLV